MYKRIIAILVFLAACAVLTGCLTGCTDVSSPAVFGYTSSDAQFGIIFESGGSGDVTASVTKTGEGVTLTVVTPERSADMRVICSPDGCVIIPAGEGGIPLSDKAAAGLTKIFSLLWRGNDGAEIRKSDDGGGTVIAYADGEVLLGGDMLPSSVTVYGDGGMIRGRTAVIQNYRIT